MCERKKSEMFTILTHNVPWLSSVVYKCLDSAWFHSRPLQVVIHNQRFVSCSTKVTDKLGGQARNQKLNVFLIKIWTTLKLEASHSEIQYLFTSQHGVMSQTTCILIITAVRTSYLACSWLSSRFLSGIFLFGEYYNGSSEVHVGYFVMIPTVRFFTVEAVRCCIF